MIFNLGLPALGRLHDLARPEKLVNQASFVVLRAFTPLFVHVFPVEDLRPSLAAAVRPGESLVLVLPAVFSEVIHVLFVIKAGFSVGGCSVKTRVKSVETDVVIV